MLRKISQKARKQDGFTLIELIVVVAILGILAAVLTPRVLDAVDNAKRNGATAFGKEVQLAMERYYLDNNGYPSVDTMEAADLTPGVRAYADLIAILGTYTTIDAAQFDSDDATFGYVGYPNDTSIVPVADAAKPPVYEIEVRLTNSAKTVTIRPTSVTVAD